MAKAKKLKRPPKRWKQKRARLWIFDFRGIQNHAPNKSQQQKLKRTYRSYRGEKPLFTSPEQLQSEIDQYFESCFGPLIDWKKHEVVRDKDGEVVKTQVKPFTVAGLAYWIGVPTETLNRIDWGFYDDLDEKTEEDRLYSAILRRAKQKIELYAEQRLYDRDGVNGARFVLDHHFRATTQREQAEINALIKNTRYKQEELELKKKMLDVGSDEDGSLQVTIVRKED